MMAGSFTTSDPAEDAFTRDHLFPKCRSIQVVRGFRAQSQKEAQHARGLFTRLRALADGTRGCRVR